MICQLRVYGINRGMRYAFPHAWIDRDRNQFIWLLAYEGDESWDEKERACYGLQERAALEPDPRQYIAQVNQWFVSPAALPR